jgi:glyoxylase-like metal-dependent hydrolase (beta-lactamase superfamily II)
MPNSLSHGRCIVSVAGKSFWFALHWYLRLRRAMRSGVGHIQVHMPGNYRRSARAGLAVVMETPAGKTYLYDTGNGYPDSDGWAGDYNAGRDTIVPYLEARGVKSLDGVLISHAHYDHFGGLLWRGRVESVCHGPSWQRDGRLRWQVIQRRRGATTGEATVARGSKRRSIGQVA